MEDLVIFYATIFSNAPILSFPIHLHLHPNSHLRDFRAGHIIVAARAAARYAFRDNNRINRADIERFPARYPPDRRSGGYFPDIRIHSAGTASQLSS